ncbi:hypothetical protein Bca101_020783 [Brassica carinata]
MIRVSCCTCSLHAQVVEAEGKTTGVLLLTETTKENPYGRNIHCCLFQIFEKTNFREPVASEDHSIASSCRFLVLTLQNRNLKSQFHYAQILKLGRQIRKIREIYKIFTTKF